MKNLNKIFCAVALSSTSFISSAGLISPNIDLEIRSDNGAIDLFSAFGGVDYFNLGAPVSDYGFAVLNADGTVSNFSNADTSGGLFGHSVDSVVESDNTTTVTGAFGDFGSFVRTYSQIGSLDVFAVDTTFTSTFDGAFTLLQYETFDPDQGAGISRGFNTFNDVVEVDGLTNNDGSPLLAATSTDIEGENPFFLASTSAFSTEAGGVFEIGSDFGLLDVLNTPVDGDGSSVDLGAHVVIQQSLEFGETFSFTTFFGATTGDLDDGLALLADGVEEATSVSEPSILALLGLGLAGIAIRRRKFK